MNELDVVVLNRDMKESGLIKGDIGTVVHVYDSGKSVEVEFVAPEGKTIAVLTLPIKDVRPMKRNEILHTRGFSAV
ncbi:DUF4926 domain-containing protein [Candidatus Microgenomates bacterium]|nr:DUF4926 domain-containing protein [Candidatus Microgenomates bacterium]